VTIPKPSGVQVRHTPGWAYVTVASKRGHAQELEYLDGDWTVAARQVGDWLVPTPTGRKMEFRARYTRADAHSTWLTGRVWVPQTPGDTGFEVDDETPTQQPDAPYDLRNWWYGAGDVHLGWSQAGQVDSWRVTARQNNGVVYDEVVKSPSTRISGLGFSAGLELEIRSRRGDSVSRVLSQVYPDFNYQPDTPTALVVTATDTTLGLAWQQNDFCEQWQVLWRPDDGRSLSLADAQVTPVAAGQTGSTEVDADPRFTITGLTPGTAYIVFIAARWRRSSYSADALQESHTTNPGGGKPARPVLSAGTITDTSIEVRWDNAASVTGWWVRQDRSRHKPVTVPRWSATGLTPDTVYEFGVIAENSAGEESDEATIRLSTSGSVPPPVEEPSTPGNVRAHCIHPRQAKVEWDDNPEDEQITHYTVTVDGADRDVIGTLIEVKNLEPSTEYTVHVTACRDDVCSRPGHVTFTTSPDGPQPDPDPPGKIPEPTGLYVEPVAGGKVRASWDRADNYAVWWLVTVDDRVWHRVTGSPTVELPLPPGSQHTVRVYALLDGVGGKPTLLSKIVTAGVVGARKGS
jgi:hypothetical protein